MSVGALPVAEYVDAAPAELRDVVREVLEPIDPLSRLGDAQAQSSSRQDGGTRSYLAARSRP